MIHATAIVSPDAELAPDVSVGPYSIIGPQVRIGAGTVIGPHVVIRGPTTLGAGNRIFQFASIGDDPQDKKFGGEATRLEIGDRNTIREYCSINRGTAQDAGVTRVGNDNWLMAYTHIAHDCQVGNGVIMSNNATLAGHVHVEDQVILSGFCAVHQFCRIGAHAFVGGLSGVTRDVLPFMMVAGHPPEPRGINQEGLKRRGFGPEQLRNLKEAYRILYRSGLRLVEAREQLAALAVNQPEVRAIVEFLDRSERSIVR
ncbi:MAG: acyl-[acyl-carrier-protein]--UDP-N-acetylglucosamine O-acyltransferase [Gammaproteobacteria bacterium]|nr:MAG: acyl-ACP--UDP-N-acetylglucosamine O-acyltransferase [Pseudomonadota bacterium]MBC6945384.1 acyl-ACP--UDP-N-acetylglucosamine O-acyltransferase [Gammaproteobacteria bacterium]MCE7895973.1 acyl-ACP--UDP-N-acetylglucosamine O-acyltransferase [Gammaproteobacteria bacterium PRO8]MDL1880482.1 acyl-ACP--UDP-N-acetylglucosamine O-acyltransferase [Gammaproteobacteria bacterium PRO2]MCL4775890.1 acyl-ACP--UDP-N-acetylglucosamine O-acyltransferase [Gammaproteobacteria bacterium]